MRSASEIRRRDETVLEVGNTLETGKESRRIGVLWRGRPGLAVWA